MPPILSLTWFNIFGATGRNRAFCKTEGALLQRQTSYPLTSRRRLLPLCSQPPVWRRRPLM